jgi:hypothetical protein
MAKPKIKNPKELAEKWEEYKSYCDNKTAICHEFSAKQAEFITVELRKPITYTIEGFCVFIGLARSKFYETYADNPRYRDIVICMKEECEIDARAKFEQGTIPTQLSGLWMSKYGYTTKQDATISERKEGQLADLIEGLKEDDLYTETATPNEAMANE